MPGHSVSPDQYAPGYRVNGISISSTVKDYLARFSVSELSWPLLDSVDEHMLEQQLFPVKPSSGRNKQAQPDWSQIHQELRHPGVTLMLLWQKYKACHPDGYQYSWFSDQYRLWKNQVDVVMRQNYIAGDKLFID